MKNLKSKSPAGKRMGCLLVTLVIVFVIASLFYFMTAGVREAKNIEQTLIDRFGWAEEYTPPADGFIDPQRLEAFIRVREAVQAGCGDYQAVLNSISELDKLESDQESSPSEVASTGMQGFKSAFSAGPKMVKFSTTRNKALLDAEMGLGEYLYIYLTVYHEQLANEGESAYSGMEEAYISERARKEFVQILTNQLLALQTSETPATLPDLEPALRAEIDALENGTHLVPWPNGPAGRSLESLAPLREKLTGLYCSGIVKIELLQKNRGFDLDG